MTEKRDQHVRRLPIPGGYGRSIKVAEGHCIAVRDIEGGQCGDFWAVDADDLNHFLSPSHTFVHIGRIQPRIGDELDLNPVGGQGITDLELLVSDSEEFI